MPKFESGVVASLMGTIKADLHMSYTLEGIVASSPDFGIVPAGVLAIFLFQYFPAYRILVSGQFVIGGAALIAVVIPTSLSLIFARALGGLFWGFAAVHYPSWINKHGGENGTVWLGLFNSCLLIGILIGYIVGAIADATNFITWRHLYGFEAVLMLITGISYLFISPELIQVLPRVRPLNIFKIFGGKCFIGGGDVISGTLEEDASNMGSSMWSCCDDGDGSSHHHGYNGLEHEEETDDSDDDENENEMGLGSDMDAKKTYQKLSKFKPSPSSPSDASTSLLNSSNSKRDPNKIRAREAILKVLSCPLYLWTVSCGAIMSGSVSFILYFITQVLKELDFFGTNLNYVLVGVIFVLSPIPGNIFGAWYVQKRLGGYRNFVGGLKFTWQSSTCSFVACIVFTLAALMKKAWGSNAGAVVGAIYVTGFYLYLFTGAAPVATINGTAVSLLPKTSIAGSGIQFSFQNTGRLIIPAIGGMVIDLLGDNIVLGFQIVLLLAGSVAIMAAAAGYREAVKRENKGERFEPPSDNEPSSNPSSDHHSPSSSYQTTEEEGSSSTNQLSTDNMPSYGGVVIDDSFDDHITL
eukprot:CAMPEP_0114340450 /NCGR_PEP_ID=MMETSP0101-20121206/8383_1 /TAXON_ID=38822 ORGANISM="Pteridomonas danica, Strain PT" /NCGR_SAMPLE_ID=MMETSP0101 /ASSEMBLY_ACC=CAM_ASM_000211 /LENGTH=580 /DNA_ID=CAMNT_0001473713 /DNA_START=142 /DNA_END=1885 /DNA_ORIENTATION=+